MTHEEYHDVRRRIGAAFPSLTAWISKLPMETKARMDRDWSLCLKRQEFADVEAAIDQLAQQREPPFRFHSEMERAGQTIARLATEIATRRRLPDWKSRGDLDGPRFDCHVCQDSGYVHCLKAADVVAAYRQKKVPVVRSTYVTFCSCTHGLERKERDLRNGFKCADYDPCRDVWADQPEGDILSTIKALIANRGEAPVPREASFDDWNEREPTFVS